MGNDFQPLKPRYSTTPRLPFSYVKAWSRPDGDLPLDDVNARAAMTDALQKQFMEASSKRFDSALLEYMSENDLTFEEMFADPKTANRIAWIRALVRAIAESSDDEGGIYFLALWMNAIDFKPRRRKAASQ